MEQYEDAMTIKAAKELCRDRHGRLPRIGYEYVVADGEVEGQGFKTYLANRSGRFYVWTWREPMPRSWYQHRGINF